MINCKNEKDTLREFISYVKKTRPLVFVTFNGDYFDWPYIDKRAAQYGMSLESVCTASNVVLAHAARHLPFIFRHISQTYPYDTTPNTLVCFQLCFFHLTLLHTCVYSV